MPFVSGVSDGTGDRKAPDLRAADATNALDRHFIRIGDLTVAIEAVSRAVSLSASDCHRAFRAEGGPPDLSLSVRWGTLDPEPEGALLFDSGASWRLSVSEGRQIYRFLDSNFGPVPYKELRLDPGLGHGEIVLHPGAFPPDRPVDPLEYPLDELLFLQLLAAHGGIELHACGVVAPSGKGYLFAGQSGDGKTTTARLWETLPGVTVLSDDRIIVRRGTGGIWWMYGTPWHGEAELATNARVPLGAILLLARGERNTLERLGPTAAVSGLLARSFVSFHDADAMAGALQLLEELTREVPCFRQPFTPGPDVVRFVLESLA